MGTSVSYSDRVDYHRRTLLGQWSRDIIMTSASNPEAMAICYAQGWASSPNFMTRQEAQAVTDIGTVFIGSNMVTFDEFKYFTSVTSLPNQAFYNSSKLTAITIPSGITTVGTNGSLGRCNKLSRVTWNSALNPYANLSGLATACVTFRTENPALTIVDDCLYTADYKTLCAVPPGKTTFSFVGTEEVIGARAFLNTSLTNGSFVFPSTVTTILETPFYDAGNKVTSIDLSNTQVTEMLNGLYRAGSNSALSTVLLPSGLTKITGIPINHVNSSSLNSVTFPATIQSIGGQFKDYWTTSVTILATTPPSFSSQQGTGNRLTTIYVPAGSVDTYKAVSRLSLLASMIQAIP